LLGATAIIAAGSYGLERGAVPWAAQAAAIEAAPAPLNAGPASFADVVDRVKPAVVSVKVKLGDIDRPDDGPQALPDFPPNSPLYRFFRRFGTPGQDDSAPRRHSAQAQGSGFFISSDGYIVTNNHVVDHATEVTVITSDGKSLPAKVIGVDSKTDVALLKAEGTDFPTETFAAQPPRVGDWVIAVGNPFGLGGTVTAGIVSARGRDIGSGPYDDFLQIDAPVNHGNSGGPTFNTQGQVVGVNTAIFSPSGGSVGIGFAISSDVVKNVVTHLKDDGKVARGWLGVQIQPVSEDIASAMGLKDTKGALVAKAEKDSPALAAGIKDGDVIVSVNGQPVADSHDLARRIAELGPKTNVELGVLRSGSTQTIKTTLGTLSDAKMAQADSDQDSSKEAAGKFGMTLAPAKDVDGAGKTGVVVSDLNPDGAAAQKGVRTGDVILEVAGKSVSNPSEVTAAIDAAKAGGKKSVLMRLKSQDSMRYVALPTEAVS
jgi:serine protease Do